MNSQDKTIINQEKVRELVRKYLFSFKPEPPFAFAKDLHSIALKNNEWHKTWQHHSSIEGLDPSVRKSLIDLVEQAFADKTINETVAYSSMLDELGDELYACMDYMTSFNSATADVLATLSKRYGQTKFGEKKFKLAKKKFDNWGLEVPPAF
jgi:DNA mismatch repair ATPase MutS